MPNQNPAPGGLLMPGPALTDTPLQRPADLMRYLQDALAREHLALEDAAVIEAELCNLLTVRRLFVAWMREGAAGEGGTPDIDPAQFLRAWNDSVTRVIQLLRARRDLASADGGEWAALIDAVYDQLEEEG